MTEDSRAALDTCFRYPADAFGFRGAIRAPVL